MNLVELVMMGDRNDPMLRRRGIIDLHTEILRTNWIKILAALARFGVYVIGADTHRNYHQDCVSLICVSDVGIFEEVAAGQLIPAYDVEIESRVRETMMLPSLFAEDPFSHSPNREVVFEIKRLRRSQAATHMHSRVELQQGPPITNPALAVPIRSVILED